MNTLDQTFQALADPTRRAMLLSLMNGEKTTGQLAAPFAVTAPAISRHLKVMENAGLISRRREAQTIYCRIRADRLKEAADWLEEYARFWQAGFDRLEELFKETGTEPEKSNNQNKSNKE